MPKMTDKAPGPDSLLKIVDARVIHPTVSQINLAENMVYHVYQLANIVWD